MQKRDRERERKGKGKKEWEFCRCLSLLLVLQRELFPRQASTRASSTPPETAEIQNLAIMLVVQQVSRNQRLLSNVKPIQGARGDGIHPRESVSFPSEEEGEGGKRQADANRLSREIHRSTNLGFLCLRARVWVLGSRCYVFAYCGRGDPRALGIVRRVLPPPRWARSQQIECRRGKSSPKKGRSCTSPPLRTR